MAVTPITLIIMEGPRRTLCFSRLFTSPANKVALRCLTELFQMSRTRIRMRRSMRHIRQAFVEQYHNVNKNNIAYDFYRDPLRLLEAWGCELTPGRNIQGLYRVREYGADAATSWKVVTVFGYALCIEDAAFE
jgi:hypothetical protein